MITKLFLGVFILLISNLGNAQGRDCNDNEDVGKDGEDKEVDGAAVGQALIMGDPFFDIDCCGVVKRWTAEIRDGTGSDSIYFQIWEPGTGDDYVLVGENSYTSTINNKDRLRYDVPANQRISVDSGFRFGAYEPGASVLAYQADNANDRDQNYFITPYPSTTNVGDTVNWPSGDSFGDRSYGMEIRLGPSSSPTFTNLNNVATIANDAATGLSIFTVSGTDPDVSDVAGLVYTMTTTPEFTFNATTGVVTVNTLTTQIGTVNLDFTVTDRCDKTDTGRLVITITNEPPVFYGPFVTYVSEDIVAQTRAFSINATDSGGSVTCTKAASTNAAFPVVVGQEVSGSYSLNITSNPGFDYDVKSEYQVDVTCSDGVDDVTQTYTIYLVENQTPVILNLQNTTSHNSTLSVAEVVFEVLHSDFENDNIRYTIECEATVTVCPYIILDNGLVLLNKSLETSTLAGYDLFITIYDEKNIGETLTLSVNILDINDAVEILGLPRTVSVKENDVVGLSIANITFSDNDVGQAHTWEINSSPAATFFDIDANGQVTVTESLNYEALGTDTTYALTITVRDVLTSSQGVLNVVVFDVNEEPTFTKDLYALSSVELTGNNVALGTPNWGVQDQDVGDTHTYYMNCGTLGGYFNMAPSTGAVTQEFNYDIDQANLPTNVTCNVTVVDSGGLTDTATLVISFTDTNDNLPRFVPSRYQWFINYGSVVGTTVGQVTALDDDAGVFGILTLDLDQSSIGTDQFAIDSSGIISVAIAPNSASSAISFGETRVITAIATDAGGETATATVTIIVRETSTAAPTTTTYKWKTFFDSSGNVGWFVTLMILLIVMFAYLTWLFCTCHGKLGCNAFMSSLSSACRRKKLPQRFERGDRAYVRKDPVSHYKGSVRNPPGPKEAQSWRQGYRL